MGKKQIRAQCLLPSDSKQSCYEQELAENPWLEAIRILEQVQGDYSQAKSQLDLLCHQFTEKETATNYHLRHIIPAFAETSSLLEKHNVANPVDRGMAIKKTSRNINSLRAYCLGNFEVQFNWKRYDRWHSLKAKSLLRYLVAQKNKPVPKEVLIETLWPECDPESGSNNLKSTVYALRQMFTKGETDKLVDSPIIVFSEGRYSIDPNVMLWVDLDEFEFNWLTGRRLEKANEMEESTRHYRLAEELYRGDYLEDEPYAEWTLLRREALKDTYLAILIKLINSSFKAEDYENCIVYSQKILNKDSCNEEAYQWLIRCYSRLGQRQRAQRWYNLCVVTLKKELDSTPNRQTTALYKRLGNEEPI
jgi:two-component SAPR family response regulator